LRLWEAVCKAAASMLECAQSIREVHDGHVNCVCLPRPIFLKIERAAELTYRSVEEVLVAAVNAALVEPSGLPADLGDELAAMNLFSDEALWAAANPSLSPAEQLRLSQLNHRAGERPLTPAEEAEQEHLLTAYHQSVLRRAQALATLSQRGYDVKAVSPTI